MVEPGLTAKAALERKVVREQIMMLGEASGVTVDYFQQDPSQLTTHGYTVLRASFDDWFATYAEQQGVVLVDGIKVDSLVEKDGVIVGIQAGDDIVEADVVIAADGVNSLFAEQVGLRRKPLPADVGIGIKETISLPAKTIESRFGLKPGEGAARVIVGGTGLVGGGFLYTNKESVSLGLVLSPEAVAGQSRKIFEILQDFKMHPAIAPLVGDGETVEFGAHLVPESGWRGVPSKLYRDGFLMIGDAAGFVINTGTTIRGIDLAMVSGVAAARAIISAQGRKTAVGPAYMQHLNELNLLPTMKLASGWPEITQNPRMSGTYPSLLNNIMQQLFTADNSTPEKLSKTMLRITRQHVSIGELLADGWKGFKVL
ncbi:hypothetical protein SDC9_93300 [bioreactor metagenome]|uniref:FixC-like C-terminal domain-containing protein n=1 Tax=bioreactor metagenome TaxID=1076179 RepID=A0A645A058_9ZZZZ